MRRILLGGLIPLDRTGALRDALAGATLASMNIPQVLGYTRIAGTPVVTGLYTVLLPSVLFAIFGSSRHLVVAADSATAAIFASSLSSMALSLLRHVRHSYLPHTAVLTPDPSGRWLPSPSSPGAETEPGLIVYRFGADLFYANDARFADEVRSLVAGAPHRVTCFLVDAGAITDLDFSAARTVRDLADELKARGVRLVFARVNAFLRADMDRHGLSAALGQPNIYPTLHDALAAVRPDLSAHDRETATPRDK